MYLPKAGPVKMKRCKNTAQIPVKIHILKQNHKSVEWVVKYVWVCVMVVLETECSAFVRQKEGPLRVWVRVRVRVRVHDDGKRRDEMVVTEGAARMLRCSDYSAASQTHAIDSTSTFTVWSAPATTMLYKGHPALSPYPYYIHFASGLDLATLHPIAL